MYDTLPGKTFAAFEKQDINGNLISRSKNNDKPAFVYYFTTSCKACQIDLAEILPRLVEEFKDEIDFILFTPADEEYILKENLPLERYSIVVQPKDFFKTGFPMAYLLNRQNDILLKRTGGGTGTLREQTLEIHYQILKEWFLRAIHKNK
jgi:thiol-disulfide isomerase/thioredoxin